MKLGELFVDLGVNSGNALNSLTNFSIKFLALKTAASQVAGVVDDLFGGTMKYGQQLEKMNFMTGVSVEWMQKMKFSAEQVGSSFETVIGTLKNLQQENAKIMMGEGNASPFQKLNIDVSKLRDPIALLDEIMAKVMRLEPAFKQAMLAELGISEDILFMYEQRTAKISEGLLLTKEEVEQVNELRKEWVALGGAIGAAWDKFTAKGAGILRVIVRGLATMFGVDLEDDEDLPSTKNLRKFEAKKVDKRKELGDIWDSFKNNILAGGVKSSQDSGSVEIETIPQDDDLDYFSKIEPQEDDLDYFNRTEPMYSYGGATVTYNDNSQTTINTSDGVEQYAKIAKDKVDKTKSEFGNIELFSRRG